MTIEVLYKTTDGEVFTNSTDAQEREKIIELWYKVSDKFELVNSKTHLSDFIKMIDFIKYNGGL
jgi:hypothetical protein